MISIEIITLLIVLVINAVTLFIIASQAWRASMANRYFIISAFFVVLWTLGTILFLSASSEDMSLFGITLFYVAPMITIVSLSLFARTFPDSENSALTRANKILLLITVVFAGAIVYWPDLLTKAIELESNGPVHLTVQPFWFSVYTLYFSTCFSVTFAELYLQIKRHTGAQRKQLQYIFAGTFAAALLSLVTNLILPLIGISEFIWLGPTWTLFYVITVAVSIAKHQLFDIKFAIVRSVVYILVLATLSIIYYLFAYILSSLIIQANSIDSIGISPINIGLALVLGFLFQPIKAFFDHITDAIFYRQSYNTADFIAHLSRTLTSTTDLSELLERAAQEISATLRAEQGFFIVFYGENDHRIAGTKQHSKLPADSAHVFDEFMSSQGRSVVFADSLIDKNPIKKIMHRYKIVILLPLGTGDSPLGYFALGEHRSGSYTKRDLHVLNAVADELFIAIQNALSIQEIRDLNTHLQQRIDAATKELRHSNNKLRQLDEAKDEFVSMASHQLRTPLTSVKGYIDMVLQGDAGKITPMQTQLLGEAFESSERMVHLINDFLNVSRLQTGKFIIDAKPVDLAKLINQEVDSLKTTAETHDLRLQYRAPRAHPQLMLDEGKIRQVIMNFIDNAIYYSRPSTTIHVILEQQGSDIVLEVRDTGIGVPANEQKHLFGKFFRATNARKQRPDGTGVGLFLAKRVIDAHHGQVIFHSKEDEGSTFGFRLPLSKLRAKAGDDRHDTANE